MGFEQGFFSYEVFTDDNNCYLHIATKVMLLVVLYFDELMLLSIIFLMLIGADIWEFEE